MLKVVQNDTKLNCMNFEFTKCNYIYVYIHMYVYVSDILECGYMYICVYDVFVEICF